ncbi:MAG: hypothetical protein JWN72_2954 [Thermoleophilia bacterium]|nr:hypothetical protein [Thermoleophilia bacterium]
MANSGSLFFVGRGCRLAVGDAASRGVCARAAATPAVCYVGRVLASATKSPLEQASGEQQRRGHVEGHKDDHHE